MLILLILGTGMPLKFRGSNEQGTDGANVERAWFLGVTTTLIFRGVIT